MNCSTVKYATQFQIAYAKYENTFRKQFGTTRLKSMTEFR